MNEIELMELHIRMDIEKYRRKYQWWKLAGIALIALGGLFILMMYPALIYSDGYYALIMMIYALIPTITGALIYYQGIRMKTTCDEMLYMINKLSSSETTLADKKF